MSMSFTADDKALLRAHLAAIIEVEFFTIPFYLTATYSFTNQALNYIPDAPGAGTTKPLYQLQQEALSVAIQEMYHLQLACNVTNAMDQFDVQDIPLLELPAGQPIPIPHLDPNSNLMMVELGDLETAIAQMVAIETADPNPFPPISPDVVYPSISDLYNATLQLIAKFWDATCVGSDPCINPNSPQVAYGTFAWTYNYNKVTKKEEVVSALNAITDQGEGKMLPPPPAAELNAENNQLRAALGRFLGMFRRADDDGVAVEFQPAAGSRFAEFGAMTHYTRFVDVQEKIQYWKSRVGWPIFYTPGIPSSDLPAWVTTKYGSAENAYEVVQAAFNTVWSAVIDAMRVGFRDGTLNDGDGVDNKPSFNDMMLTFKYSIPLLWQLGHVPSYAYVQPSDRMNMQEALDAVDPYCIVHWDTYTAGRRAEAGYEKNACQGLNTCKGLGWGGFGTQAGDGSCATADFHTCGGGNNCKHEGGCGFLSTHMVDGKTVLYDYAEQFAPAANTCAHLGGCQSPISTDQVFAHSDWTTNAINGADWTTDQKSTLLALETKNVWDHARAIIAAKLGIPVSDLPTPKTGMRDGTDYDGAVRRAGVYPSST